VQDWERELFTYTSCLQAQAQTAELEAWQRKKLREWETQDEASRLKAQVGWAMWH
jgi:hypothetical protein